MISNETCSKCKSFNLTSELGGIFGDNGEKRLSRGGNQSNFLTRDSQDSRIFERFYEDSEDSEDSGEIPEIQKRFQSF